MRERVHSLAALGPGFVRIQSAESQQAERGRKEGRKGSTPCCHPIAAPRPFPRTHLHGPTVARERPNREHRSANDSRAGPTSRRIAPHEGMQTVWFERGAWTPARTKHEPSAWLKAQGQLWAFFSLRFSCEARQRPPEKDDAREQALTRKGIPSPPVLLRLPPGVCSPGCGMAS